MPPGALRGFRVLELCFTLQFCFLGFRESLNPVTIDPDDHALVTTTRAPEINRPGIKNVLQPWRGDVIMEVVNQIRKVYIDRGSTDIAMTVEPAYIDPFHESPGLIETATWASDFGDQLSPAMILLNTGRRLFIATSKSTILDMKCWASD
jgi:hypothetical protein